MSTPINKLVVANRGEIAVRVLRTARRLGLATVAVYSDVDAGALHVTLADEAYRIGPPPAVESYLSQDAILEAAHASGADAVHPGYGFLAENPAFAAACCDAGLTFIGPPADAIKAMGDKRTALAMMAQAGVPILPGFRGEAPDAQDAQAWAQEATRVGYPLLVKPSAGGGGKGMRIVREEAGLADALAVSRREAKAAFGDDTLLLERLLERPRHVEVQIFADTHGNVLHLFERDCSIQRRHQKVIEEAPAPGMTESLRERMGAAAVEAARAAGYTGAGTIEFLLDPESQTPDGKPAFYFLEMNTRLQVEHPVTEMVLGLDLVEWQIRVAGGEYLPAAWADLRPRGHAIEARLYAEDPESGFLPAPGRVERLRLPETRDGVRIDAGTREGDVVSIHYDPMIAKIIVHGADRDAAVRRLRQSLGETQILGITTNIDYLHAIASHPEFARAAFDTTFAERHHDALLAPPSPTSPSSPSSADEDDLLLAGLWRLLARDEKLRSAASGSGDPHSPWAHLTSWRLNRADADVLALESRGTRYDVAVTRADDGWYLDLPSGRRRVGGRLTPDGVLAAELDGRRIRALTSATEHEVVISHQGRRARVEFVATEDAGTRVDDVGGGLTAPMPGRVIAILVSAGDAVERGQTLVILEAMKMEHAITAPVEGHVDHVNFEEGALVDEGAELLSLSPG